MVGFFKTEVWFAFLFTLFITGALRAAKMASLEGRVVDVSGAGLSGVQVEIEGKTSATDVQGNFAFHQLDAGKSTLVVSGSGYAAVQQPLDLAPGDNAIAPVSLDGRVVEMEKFGVSERATEATKTFADKTSSDSLTDVISGKALETPSAQPAADLLKNTPGVAIVKGADGSTNVSIRGLDARFVRVTVDGQRQGGSRNALDSIPPEVIQSLEVSKSLTPDMDADAIGGAINITTGAANLKSAYVQGRNQITSNTNGPRPGTRNSLTVGEPFSLFSTKPDSGFILTANFDDQYRHRESLRTQREWPSLTSVGPASSTEQSIPTLTMPFIESTLDHRQRSSVIFNADTRMGDTSIFWRSNYNRDWSTRNRNLEDFDPSGGTQLSLTPTSGTFSGVPLDQRNQRQISDRDSLNLAVGGKTKVGRLDLDGNVGAAFTEEKEPHTYEAVFRSDHTYRMSYDLSHFIPAYSFQEEASSSGPTSPSDINDPAHYNLNTFTVTKSDMKDHEYAGKLNLKINLNDAEKPDYLKFGGKLQERHRDMNRDQAIYGPGSQVLNMNGLVATSVVTTHVGQYRYGPIPDAGAVDKTLQSNPAYFQENSIETTSNSTTSDFTATEDIWALYGMGRFNFQNWTVVGGLRAEGTQVKTRGSQVIFDQAGNVQSITPAKGKSDYTQLLPGLHLRYDPAPA